MGVHEREGVPDRGKIIMRRQAGIKAQKKNILNYNSRCHQGCVLGCSGIWNECVNSEDLRLGKCKRPLTLCLKKKNKLYCPRQCGVLGWPGVVETRKPLFSCKKKEIRSSVRTQISPFPQFLKLASILDGAHSNYLF